MKYIEVECVFTPYSEIASEIACANLGTIGFDSFTDTPQGIKAYIPKKDFTAEILESSFSNLHDLKINVKYEIKEIAEQNWNAKWESDFPPVIINNDCIIKAPFHNIKKKYKYEILVEPKMSFGTGHHETTSLMMEHILSTDISKKNILDMGCGTGVLAILASMREAEKITAIDIDEWAYKNSIENVKRNKCQNIDIQMGDAQLIENKKYDIILANINRNILMNDIRKYSDCLSKNGLLFLSGFYQSDLEAIKKECNQNNLEFETEFHRNNWVAAKFLKSE